MSKNLSELSARQGLENSLFEKLADNSSQQQVADEFLIGRSSVKGAISFYDFLKDENKNKKIYICNGSACMCAGTQDKLVEQLQEYFTPSEIGHMTCLGRCHENSAFHYAGQNYSALDKTQIEDVIKNKSTFNDHYLNQGMNDSVLTNTAITVKQFSQAFDQVLKLAQSTLLAELTLSGLRGRGGAGFPIAYKLESAMNTSSERKYIICNADEGDPGAYSDRYLLEQQPLLVLFGMMVSAYIVGAHYGILYIRAEYPQSITVIKKTIQQLQSLIKKTKFDFKFKIIAAQGAYICGEETALINSIEGQRPEVRVRPPFPTQQGLFNKPTVVNNVETLASIFSIITKGGDLYQKLGTEKSNGTKLISLDSFFNKPGIYEIEMGTELSYVFEKFGGGFKQTIKAVQIGGPLGGIIPMNKIKDLTLDFESFSQQGFLLGHASVVCIPEEFPMVEYIHHLFQFAAYESCGKCFPCRLGTKRGEELFVNAIKQGQKIDRQLLDDLLDTLQQGSLCAHGGGIPLPIRNVLKYFPDELVEYFMEPMI